MYGPGPALVSSGAGALHSKCPRGRRGSLGAGGTRELALPAPYTANEPRAASRRNGAQFCWSLVKPFFTENDKTRHENHPAVFVWVFCVAKNFWNFQELG